jgi:acyl-CoA reductase-like NAD-dependent aldehyde dehydrogenase
LLDGSEFILDKEGYQHEIEVGQEGINVPVPLRFLSFTGWKNRCYVDLYAYGKQAVGFYTETKKIIAAGLKMILLLALI